MWGPTHNLGPIGSGILKFIGYKNTDRQTDRQAKYKYIDTTHPIRIPVSADSFQKLKIIVTDLFFKICKYFFPFKVTLGVVLNDPPSMAKIALPEVQRYTWNLYLIIKKKLSEKLWFSYNYIFRFRYRRHLMFQTMSYVSSLSLSLK